MRPRDPEAMSPEERFDELTSIFAAALLRSLRPRGDVDDPDSMPPTSGDRPLSPPFIANRLDLSDHQSVHGRAANYRAADEERRS